MLRIGNLGRIFEMASRVVYADPRCRHDHAGRGAERNGLLSAGVNRRSRTIRQPGCARPVLHFRLRKAPSALRTGPEGSNRFSSYIIVLLFHKFKSIFMKSSIFFHGIFTVTAETRSLPAILYFKSMPHGCSFAESRPASPLRPPVQPWGSYLWLEICFHKKFNEKR